MCRAFHKLRSAFSDRYTKPTAKDRCSWTVAVDYQRQVTMLEEMLKLIESHLFLWMCSCIGQCYIHRANMFNMATCCSHWQPPTWLLPLCMHAQMQIKQRFSVLLLLFHSSEKVVFLFLAYVERYNSEALVLCFCKRNWSNRDKFFKCRFFLVCEDLQKHLAVQLN